MDNPIPVICDRCRAEGAAGGDPFHVFGALLDFEPVPRLSTRADGWDAEVQRAYIAALSLTGSDRAACRAVGKSAFGVTQLLAHDGGEGFRAAREEALAIAADERRRRLAEGLRAVAAEDKARTLGPAPWSAAAARNPAARWGRGEAPSPPEPEETDEQRHEWLHWILRKYLIKVRQERTARLEGKIVEADWYLRQATWLEVALDMTSGDGFELLRDFREQGCDLIDIAETPMSRL